MKSTKRVRGGGEVNKIFGEDYGRCMIEYGKKIEMLLGWNVAFVDPKGNHAGKLEDGALTWYLPRQDIDENIHNVAGVYNKCKEDNIDFLYVIAPPKVNIKQDESIAGKLDFSIQNKDKFVRSLVSDGIPILDLGYGLDKIYDNHHQMFFRTDHHWKPETALTAVEIVSKDINYKNGYHIDTDKFNADLYEKKIYTKSFLGSQGKKVTLSQVEPDDFILLRPKFAVNVNLKIPSFNVDVTGDFDIMLNPCMYENISGMQLYSANAYGGYLYGDWSVLKIHNYDNNVAHKKI